MAAELPAWAAIVAGGDVPLAARPLDPARDTATATATASATVAAGGELLAGVPAVFHGGPQDVLLAGLAAAVVEWRRRRGLGGGPVLADVEGHGREPFTAGADLSRTVGWFTSIYPVRLDPGGAGWDQVITGGAAAGRLVKAVKEQLRAVPGSGLGYGLLRYLNPATAARLAALPAPRIGFNYLGRFSAGTRAQPARTARQAEGPGDWQPAGTGLGGGGDGDLPAAHELISTQALEELAGCWAAALDGIAAHAARPGTGGHTPSDFPLVDLRQEQVDEPERELNDGD